MQNEIMVMEVLFRTRLTNNPKNNNFICRVSGGNGIVYLFSRQKRGGVDVALKCLKSRQTYNSEQNIWSKRNLEQSARDAH
jgi:hypothetical protein